jgi:hypothetical protein
MAPEYSSLQGDIAISPSSGKAEILGRRVILLMHRYSSGHGSYLAALGGRERGFESLGVIG